MRSVLLAKSVSVLVRSIPLLAGSTHTGSTLLVADRGLLCTTRATGHGSLEQLYIYADIHTACNTLSAGSFSARRLTVERCSRSKLCGSLPTSITAIAG